MGSGLGVLVKRFFLVVPMILLSGCAANTFIPDKFAFQVNTDPNKDGSEFVDQLRFGLVWDIPQLEDD